MNPVESKKIYAKIPEEMLKRIKAKIYTVRSTLNAVIYHTEEPVPFPKECRGKKSVYSLEKIGESCLIALGFILRVVFLMPAKIKRRCFC